MEVGGAQNLSASYSLVLFDGFLLTEYMHGLEMFSLLVDICARAEVRSEEVQILRFTAVKYIEQFERCYFRYEADRVDFCKSVIHVLLHLADCMDRYGPLIGVSQYCLEGCIGWAVQRNKSKTRPTQSMIKSAMFSEALKIFCETGLYEGPSKSNIESPLVFGLLVAPKRFNLRFADRGR